MGIKLLLLSIRVVIIISISIVYSISIYAEDSTIYFNDSSDNYIVLGNTVYWEAAFRKSNGSIIYILNKQSGNVISEGNSSESIWKAEMVGGGEVSSRSWNSSGFSYSWSETEKALILRYPSEAVPYAGANAEVIITASTGNWMDLKLTLEVKGNRNTFEYIHFPSELMFSNSSIEEALYPSMPGLLFNKTYFAQKIAYEATYPGYPGIFADFFWISTSDGTLTLYSVGNVDPLIPLRLGFGFSKANGNDYAYWIHKFGAWKWQGQVFSSPLVRIRIGETKNSAAVSYRIDNDIDSYDSLNKKLGELYQIIAASLEVKMDASVINIAFDRYKEIIFPNIPIPSILHFAAIQPRGFDENTPDILPPNPRYGTTETYKKMVSDAKALGFLIMPYTNPTWWDNESNTVRNLPAPLSINDISVITDTGKPLYEKYNSKGGYTVCPWAPYVMDRIQASHQQMKNEVLSDIIFEDQIGARSWWFDFNANAPSVLSYIDGWLNHTRKFKDNLLATEQGFDRLAETEVGFYGSVQYLEKTSEAHQYWGSGTWTPFPLAQMMMRDKVSFYQHDLSEETMTSSKENLIWNASYGYQLNYSIHNTASDDHDWLKMISAIQKDVFSQYADHLITDFQNLDIDFSMTAFDGYTVYTNWNSKSPRIAGKHSISPEGFASFANDGTLNAGIFAGYNGVALSNGDHYIIEDRKNGVIRVKQPLGGETQISIEFLSDWKATDRINVFTYLQSRKSFTKIPSVINGNLITFNVVREISGDPIDIFLIVNYH